ncbi:MAG: hypothetical protein QGH33_12875 [Pirellulaceae bacterium]|jgi:Na+/citrate or Na+/malate symporter|nr:hypothetical protein [Pirellulaceae bacterium]HJN10865.1 hypothetical protein [Pirellulaceae bacterium]
MIDRPRNHHYQVPRQFGLRTILVVTALFAGMLSIIKWTDASPEPLIFYSSFIIVVGGAQVVFERSPRLASILAGSVFLLILKSAAFVFGESLETINVGLFMGLFAGSRFIYSFIYSLLFGALYGYLAGTMLAGLYLVVDRVQIVTQWRYRQDRMSTGVSR